MMHNLNNQIVIAVGVITNEQGDVFFTQRHEPRSDFHSKWELPGGGIEHGESVIGATLREVKEETGFDVEVVGIVPKVFDVVHPDGLHVIMISHLCKIVGGEFKPQDEETMDGKFISKEDMDKYEFLPMCREVVEEINK